MPPAAAGILNGVTAAGASGTAVGATAGASTASGAGTTAATTGGSLAATSGGGASGGDIAGSIMSGSSLSLDLNSFLNPGAGTANAIFEFSQGQKDKAAAQANLDRAFYEDKRRYGLQYALAKFSQRYGITVDEANRAYQREMNQQNRGITYPAAVQSLRERRMNLQWAEEDRENKKRLGNAYVKGLARGLYNGGQK